jgi:hypothetical protein
MPSFEGFVFMGFCGGVSVIRQANRRCGCRLIGFWFLVVLGKYLVEGLLG